MSRPETELQKWIRWTIDKKELRNWVIDELFNESNGLVKTFYKEKPPAYTKEQISQEIDNMLSNGMLSQDCDCDDCFCEDECKCEPCRCEDFWLYVTY